MQKKGKCHRNVGNYFLEVAGITGTNYPKEEERLNESELITSAGLDACSGAVPLK